MEFCAYILPTLGDEGISLNIKDGYCDLGQYVVIGN